MEWFLKLQIVHTFLDMDGDPRTKILNTFFSLFMADLVFLCKKANVPSSTKFSLLNKSIWVQSVSRIFCLIQIWRKISEKVHQKEDNPENCFSKRVRSTYPRKTFSALTFCSLLNVLRSKNTDDGLNKSQLIISHGVGEGEVVAYDDDDGWEPIRQVAGPCDGDSVHWWNLAQNSV
jgi:hypothetical protein